MNRKKIEQELDKNIQFDKAMAMVHDRQTKPKEDVL